ncbi:MAG: hypothetical protein JWN40_464 [Phycisphaerales bacterium]|nr:hypothetical protein [Phycisphaerales bacterium]
MIGGTALRQGATVKNAKSILLCLAVAMTATAASAQEGYAPPPGDSRIEQVRSDADNARRRESDLAARIVDQERTNASIRDQLRKVDGDPAGLQRDLVDVSDQAATLRKKVADQRQRRDAAEDKLNDARGRAMDRYEQTQSMATARRSVEDAATDLDRLSQPILEQLAQDPGYQDAQALVDAAAQAGEALQGFDNVDPKAQADADSAFDQAMARVREMEDAAIDADPRAAEAHKSVRIAQATLEGLRSENEKKIKTDPAVDAARFALDLEQKLLDDSSADLSVAERRLSALRQTTQPNAGPPTELANQLKEGEARLRDLNDQLDQARVARQDIEDRLRYAQGNRAPDIGGEPYSPAPLAPAYPDGYYDDGGGYAYGGGGYGYPYSSYSAYSYYPAYRYRSYAYDPFYCPPYYSSFGFGLSFGSYYRHSYARDYHHFRDDSWRNRYDYWRGRDGFRDGRNTVAFRDGRSNFGGDRRYDYSRFDRNEIGRDRTARTGLDRARLSTADTERDYRYRAGVTTYNYPGSTSWRQRDSELASARARQYELDARERRSAAESDARRAGIPDVGRTSSSSSARLAAERSASADARSRETTDARRARADEAARAVEASRSRTEWRPRTSEDETRGTRPNEDFRRSSGSNGDSAAAAAASRARASDADVRRARASEEAPRRDATPPPSRSRASDAPAAAPSRSRSADAPPPPPAPSRSRSSDAPAPSRGSSRSESSSPPPSSSSGRSSSRGGGGGGDSAPPSGGSSRGSARGGDSSPPPAASSGRGSSSSGGGSSRSGSSNSDSGSSRGRR